MEERIYYARTREDDVDLSSWQKLEDHLHGTAKLASHFCSKYKWETWAYFSGLLHDLGKYSDEFQKRLMGSGQRVIHSTAGAKEAECLFSDKSANEHYIARILGFIIAGHHAGLPDGNSADDSCLTKRLSSGIADYSHYPDAIIKKPQLNLQDIEELFINRPDKRDTAFGLAFFIRILFSCLVDADRLDSEAFCDSVKHSIRRQYPSIEEMNGKLVSYLETLSRINSDNPINRIRARILSECCTASLNTPGIFSLTVPTGGGKTLSSLAFAFSHALRFGLERVIYVIPYTSIIEQNADVFRRCLGNDSVVEHHSNFDTGDEKEDLPRKLATENWDAPLIVTTNVQFFESLFSHHPSRCRKLHNIMNSVVILDEAQMLPPELLIPCIGALHELSERYKTTVLLCTATQPALGKNDGFKRGFENVREIIADREHLYNELKRVNVINLGKLSEEEFIHRFSSHPHVLCIVNTKARAKKLYKVARDSEGIYHLSASMCPAHRSERLKEIRNQLEETRKPCRVVSTQLVEAGVDIDFPVVYREIAGLDSLIQAAGRCNREGRLSGIGKVFVFESEEGETRLFRQQIQATRGVMRRHEDIFSLDAIRDYFSELYWVKGEEALDSKTIYNKLENSFGRTINFPFREIGESFRLIDDDTRPIIIQWKRGKELVQKLRRNELDKNLLRKLQRYTVNVYAIAINALESTSAVEKIHERFYVLVNESLYSEDIGLMLDNPYFHEPESLIV